jgi:hypothetical protein
MPSAHRIVMRASNAGSSVSDNGQKWGKDSSAAATTVQTTSSGSPTLSKPGRLRWLRSALVV